MERKENDLLCLSVLLMLIPDLMANLYPILCMHVRGYRSIILVLVSHDDVSQSFRRHFSVKSVRDDVVRPVNARPAVKVEDQGQPVFFCLIMRLLVLRLESSVPDELLDSKNSTLLYLYLLFLKQINIQGDTDN